MQKRSILRKQKILAKQLKKFHGIYVETTTMEKALAEQGFTNTYVVPNCKELRPIKTEELLYQAGKPYKLCTFSRVMKHKGIEDAIAAVTAVNKAKKSGVYTLDIYGQIDSGETDWFAALQETFPPYVCYRGLVPFDQSVAVLKEYFALLFPTRFYTEGVPGTIIDAYAAGIPVISAKWESFGDIVEEGVCGLGYEFGNLDALSSILSDPSSLAEWVKKSKNSCLQKAEPFRPAADGRRDRHGKNIHQKDRRKKEYGHQTDR